LRIIEDILDISKIEVGQLKLINSEFYIKELFASIYDSYKLNRSKYGKNKEVELICYLPANIKKLKISLDKQRLNQIFTNLLDNAYKFTPKGNIEYGCKLNELTQLIFWVKDSGIGIPPEKHSIIFDRFRQADELNMETQVGGTGLGLSIVQGIIKLMNGKIWVESEVNIGTTFYFTLPTIITKEVENK
jgi:signal transduction histidine kinase